MDGKRMLLALIAITCLLFVAGCGVPADSLPPTPEPAPTPIPPTPTSVPAAAALVTVEPTPQVGELLVIFDDDGSRDGLAALLYLLSDPDLSIQAVSISYGEAHPALYVQHIGRVLDDLGIRGIPLGAGQDAPLADGVPFPDWLRRLSDNFWDFPLPNADRTYPFRAAPELILETINHSPRPVTIFLSGTFTNLAQALRLDPAVKANIAAVYFMGGAVYAPGNITNLLADSTNRVAEWNIYADPQAAGEVFASGLEMYMVPLDATNQVILSQADIQPWHAGGKKASLAAGLYDVMFDSYGFKTVEIFDLTAAVILANPDLCAFQPLHLDVLTGAGNTFGQTVVVPNLEPNIHVCLEPDVGLIRQDLNARFSGAGLPLETPPLDPLIGAWAGSVRNGDFEMQISITIDETCQLGQVCGRFDISTVSCSGSLTWVGMEEDLYQFKAGDKTEACGDGDDYLLPQPDGTLLYISRGDYGETKGALQRTP